MKMPFLMCKPLVDDETSYLAEREKKSLRIDKRVILHEWEKVHEFLASWEEIRVEVMSAARGLPDMIFAASAAFVDKRTAILSSFNQARRIPENAFFRDWLKRKQYKVIQLAPLENFEGSRCIQKIGDMLFACFPNRSERWYAEELEKIVFRKITSLQIIKNQYLDQSVASFQESAIVDESSLDEVSLGIIRDWAIEVLPLDSEEKKFLPTQTLFIGKKALVHSHCPKFQEALEERGFKVYSLEFPELLKLGAGPKGLVLEL